MKKIRFLLWIILLLAPLESIAQEVGTPSSLRFTADLNPIEFGFRYDDNVFRAVDMPGRLSDGVYLLNGGAHFSSAYDVFKADLDYHLGADQYQFYSVLNNIKNNFDLLIDAEIENFSFYYRKEYFIRDSQYGEFNYLDDGNILGALWSPPGSWNYEVKYKNFSRQYYNGAVTIQAQNFLDQGLLIGIQREIDEKVSVKAEGSYNNRHFNRYSVGQMNGTFIVLPSIQADETWSVLLNAHIYFESILQDINFEEQRTNSNSYGFSDTVQSISWAGVVRPSPTIYLQLIFRLFSKTYDAPPIVNPDLQIGFVDEDSQDLLSIKTSWEWAPQWTASLSLSRVRNEYLQPGEFYIEDLLSASVQRKF